MQNFTKKFGFIFALLICFAILISCGDKKDKEESKKEDTKKEETKKEEVKEKTVAGGNQVYFVEEYTSDGQEIGKSDKFFISSKGGYLTAMLKTAEPIGVGKVDVRLERESLDGSEIVDTQPYDVFPDKNFHFFEKLTFYKSGDYKVTVFKKDGTVIATGNVRIEFK